ncbi:hypothetical protein LPC08_01765 [Roseomonas sp. OT10]|uniref:hypothetical protein n=1 Tax=Roseomonas cutis TaxID=2897332 RepID=UPI001E3A7232|nr:hypothetical protein [Roseomonas sp. OT10]UFN49398.1 hypothetical protein LPC08_01765 [Roseomonas sp. OT10]
MAEHAHSTPADTLGRRPPTFGLQNRCTTAVGPEVAAQRAALESIVARALAMLDALDGDPDMEPNADGEAEPDEASLHPATLAADRVPAVVVRFPARSRQVPGISGQVSFTSRSKHRADSLTLPPPAFTPGASR